VFALAERTTLTELRARHAADASLAEHFERLDRYFGYLKVLGVADWVELDLTIVRGLAYYTGVVFELFDAKGEFRAICGGGRYDQLLGALGGTDLPALGFGMGDVVLGELLRARGLMPAAPAALDYWVAADDVELLPMVMGTATLLRRLGYAVEYALRDQQLGKQLKAAASAGAHVAAIFRRNAVAQQGQVTLRRLSDGVEEVLPVQSWLEQLTSNALKGAQGPPPAGGTNGQGAAP
jgi:histidyl-tRNA synthetase